MNARRDIAMTHDTGTPPHEQARRPLMTVDFVTALSVEECRAALAAAERANQPVELWDDHSFTVLCCGDEAEAYEARFWGTLEPRDGGAWVWGTTIEDTGGRRRPSVFRPTLVVVVLIVLAAEAFVRGARQATLIWLALLAGLGAVWLILWIERHRRALGVVMWVWETLWVPVKKTGQPDEGVEDGPRAPSAQ
jgi:hypothetical protein